MSFTPVTDDTDHEIDGDGASCKSDDLSLDGIIINPEDPGASYRLPTIYPTLELPDVRRKRDKRRKRKKKKTKSQKVKKFLGIILMVVVLVGLAAAMMSILRREQIYCRTDI